MFQSLAKEAAEYGQATGHWDAFRAAAIAEEFQDDNCRYYLMEYGGMDCQSSRRFKLR
jgi:hypothetical protein